MDARLKPERSAPSGKGGGGLPAVFLDRDGTIIDDGGYVNRWQDASWIPGAASAIRRLQGAGFLIVVVTNQSGVARGYFTMEAVDKMHALMSDELASLGASFDAIYTAPYHPEGTVELWARAHPDRKPGTGLFKRAVEQLGVESGSSFVVGDRETDLIPGKRMGMTALLVLTGQGRLHARTGYADHVAPSLAEAADWIIRESSRGRTKLDRPTPS